MKLLYTGANGFLGKNVIPSLKERGFDVYTLSRSNADYNADLSAQKVLFDENFDSVIHAAGKAHLMPENEAEKQDFFKVNVTGTKNLCESLENQLPKHFVYISTVAVYGKDSGKNISENFQLCGNSPYAKSKIEAENFLKAWCQKYGVFLTILRPSLIAGIDPPGNLGAMIKGIKSGFYFNIDGGKAKKSIVWAEDFAEIINLALSKNGGTYNVCADSPLSFGEISSKISQSLQQQKPKNIPLFVAQVVAFIGDFLGKRAPIDSSKLRKMTQDLTFSNAKIKQELGWKPTSVLEKL